MNLDEQIQDLIDNAPANGVNAKVMEQAIAPVLKLFATQLQHLEYYIPQNLEKNWVLTTLSNRNQPEIEKKVIYAFATLKDAANFQGNADPQIFALPVSVSDILFQTIALEGVDSVIFLDTPGNLTAGTEVSCPDLKRLVEMQLQQFNSFPQSKSSNLPPDIA